MKTFREPNARADHAHVSLVRYGNLNNIAHYHDDFELIYIEIGEACVSVQECTYRLTEGMCAFVHSNAIHEIQSNESTVISVMKADGEYFGNLFTSRRLSSPILTGRYDMERVIKEIRGESRERRMYSDVVVDCLMMRFFVDMLRQEQTCVYPDGMAGHALSANDLYMKISQKIMTDYATLTFSEAAEYLHLSKPYFSKVFHSLFGMTFTHYLSTVRVASAIEKLRAANSSMTQIAASCGFNTIRNFNRVFKTFTGYSPNALPQGYVFLYSLCGSTGLDPTLNCTRILD